MQPSSTQSLQASPVTAAPGLKAILPTVAASALEGYDLTIYGLFAGTIARQFFPSGDSSTGLLLAVATLGVGYVVRPLGGLVMGAYGDRAGRKPAIFLTVALMALSTGVMGLIPSYASIGMWAPLMILAARLVQGFAAGGGGSSISFLAEVAPPEKRGFYASWLQASQIGAFLLASALAALIAHLIPEEGGSSIGWRIPFLLALALGPAAWLIKSRLREPAVFVKDLLSHGEHTSIAQSVFAQWGSVAIGFGVSCLWTITSFLLLIFMPTYANRSFGIPLSGTYTSAMIGGVIVFVMCPLMGRLSDWVGRRATMMVAALLFASAVYPLFAYLDDIRTLQSLVFVQAALSVLIAAYTGPIGAFMAELFPTRIRSTGVSIAANLAATIVGAFGPFFTTWLIRLTGDPRAPAYYIAGGAIASFVALWFARDRTGQALSG